MSIAKINFFSHSIHMRIEVTVLLPEYPEQRDIGGNYKKKYPQGYKFPVVYFLNGFKGDYTDGLTMIPLERYAQETGLAVVLPSGLNTWYENVLGGPHMKTFIGEELPAAMEAIFPIADTADKRFIAGLSMGGRGAAMISAQYFLSYRATVCLSAPFDLHDMLHDAVDCDGELLKNSLERALGGTEYLDAPEHNYYSLVEQVLENRKMIPEMLYLFGNDDPLYPKQYPKFAAFVRKNALPVNFEVWENRRHDFDFWDPAMHKAMNWLALRANTSR